MKRVSRHVFHRGKSAIYCRRCRIPADIRAAYRQGTSDVVRSSETSDRAQAEKRLHRALVSIENKFEERAKALREGKPKFGRSQLRRVKSLSDEELQSLSAIRTRQVLLNDEQQRAAGMGALKFDKLKRNLERQRNDLGRMLFTRAQACFMCGRGIEPRCDFQIIGPRYCTGPDVLFIPSADMPRMSDGILDAGSAGVALARGGSYTKRHSE